MGKFLNTAKLYLLTSLVHLTYAIPGTITPLDPILAVGSDVNITCTLNTTQTTRTADEIIWTMSFFNPTPIDSSNVDVISDAEAMISLHNLTSANNGDSYYCYLPGDNVLSWIGTVLHIGLAPTKPTLECFSTNIVDYWCEWSKVEDTALVVNYTFQYQYPLSSIGEFEWRMCPEYVTEYKCRVPMSDGEGNPLNPGIQHGVRVIVQNYLGNSTTEMDFWPEMAAVPLPPRIESVESSQTSLKVQYVLTEDIVYYKSSLRYHVRYSSNDSPGNWTEDSNLANRDDKVTINGLEYYTWYNLQVRAQFTYNEWSDWGETYQARTLESVPVPEGSVNFTVTEIIHTFTRDIWLRWTEFPEGDLNGKLNGYRVTLWKSDSFTKIQEYQVSPNAISYYINQITLYEEFYVSVVAYSSAGETRQDKKQILDKTDEPGIPVDLDGEVLSSDMINVSWRVPTEPGSINLTYQLQWGIDGNLVETARIVSNAKEETVSYMVNNLEAYTKYQFQVKAGNHMGYGRYSNIIEPRTFESVPGNISTLSVSPVEEDATVLNVRWSAPAKPNGVISKYNIYYQQYPNGSVDNLSVTPGEETYLLRDLQAYKMYTVWITANNSAGEGASSTKVVQMTSQGTPSVPRYVTVSHVTNNSLMIDWDVPEQTNGIIKHYKIKWRNVNETTHLEKTESATQTKIVDLLGYTEYVVSVIACSESHADHACGQEALLQDHVKTLIGVPGPPRNLNIISKSSETIEIRWSVPELPNGPIDHYLVVYENQNMKMTMHQVEATTFATNVRCSVKETLKYMFTVQAVNRNKDDTLLYGPEAFDSYDFGCDPITDPTIILYILIPSVVVLMFVLLGFIFKNKYHDKYFTTWPEPKIVQVMIDPELSPPPIEKEMFDDLKTRPHSQSSNGSSASSDQGFHEMSLCLSRIDLKTQEQKVHYDNRSAVRSNSLTDELEDDTFYPQKHEVRIENEEQCQSSATYLENTGQEYFHMNYEYNLADEVKYHRIVLKGSQEELASSQSDNSQVAGQSKSFDNTPDIDPYIKLVPASPTDNTSIQPVAYNNISGENCTYIRSTILNEEKNFDSAIDPTAPEVDEQTRELPQAQNSGLISGDYITSSNFREMHQMSDASVDDADFSGTGSDAIDDYSQVEMENLSEFLDNIAATN